MIVETHEVQIENPLEFHRLAQSCFIQVVAQMGLTAHLDKNVEVEGLFRLRDLDDKTIIEVYRQYNFYFKMFMALVRNGFLDMISECRIYESKTRKLPPAKHYRIIRKAAS